MADTRIEWADVVWNPTTGCTRASEGCDNCYAVKMTKRLDAMGIPKYQGLVNIGKSHFNGVVKCHDDELLKPLKWKKPRRIFVNSMSDLFHEGVPFEFVDKVLAVMALCPHHTFMVLTKRAERMKDYFLENCDFRFEPDRTFELIEELTFDTDLHDTLFDRAWEAGLLRLSSMGESGEHRTELNQWPLKNILLGISVENQEQADKRHHHLATLHDHGWRTFWSAEPLLGHVSISHACYAGVRLYETEGAGLDWVICGGESGSDARPMHPEWARSLRDQCKGNFIPFHFKQWGEWAPRRTDNVVWDEHLGQLLPMVIASSTDRKQVGKKLFHAYPSEREEPPGAAISHPGRFSYFDEMNKVGKKAAGRELDGRTWDEFPEAKNV